MSLWGAAPELHEAASHLGPLKRSSAGPYESLLALVRCRTRQIGETICRISNSECGINTKTEAKITAKKRYGAPRETRTPDLLITNQPLYQLSYKGILALGVTIFSPGVKQKCSFSQFFGCVRAEAVPEKATVASTAPPA